MTIDANSNTLQSQVDVDCRCPSTCCFFPFFKSRRPSHCRVEEIKVETAAKEPLETISGIYSGYHKHLHKSIIPLQK